MDHGFKLYPDGTLEITLPQGTKVGRVLVCEAGTQDGQIYYSDGLIDQYKWERDVAISQLHDLGYELGEKLRIPAEPKPSRDVVDRATMLETYADLYDMFDSYPNICNDIHVVYDKLRNLPSAQLERKKGKWIYFDPNGFKCSECGGYLEIEVGDVKMNFCPNCGSYNGGEKDG